MIIHRGTDKDNSIKIKYPVKNPSLFDQIVAHYLDELFGFRDGDYFIHTAQERTDNTGRRFRILFVEDKETIKHQVFFEYIPTT